MEMILARTGDQAERGVEENGEESGDDSHEDEASDPAEATTVMNDWEDGIGQRKFSKSYVCFDAYRRGFLSGCRPVIGVDGCHLKGLYRGVLLTAVSTDPNNNLYPLAYPMVARETRESWQWFLELLNGDLHILKTCSSCGRAKRTSIHIEPKITLDRSSHKRQLMALRARLKEEGAKLSIDD
ncbi:UNVERIFIED_CONTAM: hypothetical protein Sangu_1870600 [Sesamum angustifolium]|uniref:MULE transposase domain-containing protein n=1 Tax=Sesamum angustifolium TaxID=2727405 RepID=A0AAW2LUV0_9LAMI